MHKVAFKLVDVLYLRMNLDEEQQTIVTSKRACFEDTYGEVIIETHCHPETGKQYRPFGLPAYLLYDAKTLRPVYREWMAPGVGHGRPYRVGGLPSRISSHPNQAFMEWTNEEGYTIHTAFPIEANYDPQTDEIIGFTYGQDVLDYIRGVTGKSPTFPVYDMEM